MSKKPEPVTPPRAHNWSRRKTIQAMGAMVGSTLTPGCDSEPNTAGPTTPPSDSETDSGSAPQCDAPSDLSAATLLAEVDTIVVVMMENRSFDHYFGSLSAHEGAIVDSLNGRESNPTPGGNPLIVHPSDRWVVNEDPPHDWASSHGQWNNGKNDGFVRTHLAQGGTNGSIVMGYHNRVQLPVLYALADEYVLCDRWFASVMGPTLPNRWHLHLGTSQAYKDNPGVSSGLQDLPNIFTAMETAGFDSRYYNAGLLPFPLSYGRATGIEKVEQFFEDAAGGNLPSLCVVDPIFTALDTIGNDDHPPADIRMGQAFLSTIYQALAQSPQWDRCLLLITYDEHGGFFDHVPPPQTFDERPDFRQLGFRVPSLVVGPHVRRGCVSSVQFDHVAVAATLTARFGAAPLNARVAQSNDLSHVIDPATLGAPRPPAPLPPVMISSAAATQPRRRPGRNFGGQIELWNLADRGGFPRNFDRRREVDDVVAALLDHGSRLGAIRLV